MSKALEKQLNNEITFLRKELQRLKADPPEFPFHACDNSCATCRPSGMSTNGGCRCDENKLRAALHWWRGYVVHLRATIDIMKNGDSVKNYDERLSDRVLDADWDADCKS